MKIYIDTEFNEFKGQLISLALVAEDGREFYEVLHCENPGPWVAQHVMPILNKAPIPFRDFQYLLQAYLLSFSACHIVADWPEDIEHFCACLITGPGERINTPKLTFEIDRNLPNTSDISAAPHNALEDARALQRAAA